jgi:hypothetical protein
MPVPEETLGEDVRYLFAGHNCAEAITKRVYSKAWAPGEHQQGDGWLLQYRIIYDAVVKKNKALGLYLNKKGTA